MLPVLGGEVEERQQHVGVLLKRHPGLRVLRTILDREPPDGLAHLRAGLGVRDLAQRGLHARLLALRWPHRPRLTTTGIPVDVSLSESVVDQQIVADRRRGLADAADARSRSYDVGSNGSVSL